MDVSAIRRAAIACAAAAVAVGLALLGPAPSGAVTVTPVAKGLDNPRALAFDSDGHLFVAEAGHGSEPPEKECVSAGPTGKACFGFTSGVSKIENGVAHRVVDGYASIQTGPFPGSAALGISGISILGDWRLFALEGENEVKGVPPMGLSKATTEGFKEELGRLYEFLPGGHRTLLANVGAEDFEWSEDEKALVPEQFPDSNPYAVLATDDGEWVINAASNTLDWVHDGIVKQVAYFPRPEKNGKPVSDAVPTCVAKGRDGALYVSQLTGAGNGPGQADVFRVEPGEQRGSALVKPEVWAKGLTAVTGCGFDSDGDFFAVEFSTLGFESFEPGTGALVRVPPHSTSPVTVVSKLSFPNGFASKGHDIYTSTWSIAPSFGIHGQSGEVLRITH